MSRPFNCIGLVGVPRKHEALDTHKLLHDWLKNQGYKVLIDNALKEFIPFPQGEYCSIDVMREEADLAIVVGGDGNMLRTARALSGYKIRIIGVNRGNLGFLTEINPETAFDQLNEVLKGHFIDEPRLLLEISIFNSEGQFLESSFAVNEIVLHPSKVAHMISYEAYIDDKNAFMQRADGLIISTPTGSTAYSLSAGGPIIASSLDAMIITPMFPHSLSARPLVISADSTVRLKFPEVEQKLEIACDSQVILPVNPNDEIVIKKAKNKFNLIHACDYDYFRILSTKLGWAKSLF